MRIEISSENLTRVYPFAESNSVISIYTPENFDIRNGYKKATDIEINWFAAGSIPIEEAEEFRDALSKAIDVAKEIRKSKEVLK